VKIRGHRIELGEIENALSQHPAVREAVVIAREDTPGDRQLVGYVTPGTQSAVDAAEIRVHLQQLLPEFMIPSQFVWLTEFPLTPNCKIDRKSLPSPNPSNTLRSVPFVEARSATEASIARIWHEVLNTSPIGIHDDFFALGGHSLSAMQLIAELRSALHVDLSPRVFFAAPTVSALAREVDALHASGTTAITNGISRASRLSYGVSVAAEIGATKGQRAG
jgi:acyl carrier protein